MRLFLPPLRRHRHPLLRLLAAVVGIAVLGFLFVFGLLALSILLVVGAVLLGVRQWRAYQARHGHGQAATAHAPPPPPGIIEGQFVVVRHSHHQPTH